MEIFTNVGPDWHLNDIPEEVKTADLILHHSLSGSGNVRFSEWIVLKPAAISDFTADPEALPPSIKRQLQLARSLPASLKPEEIHYQREQDPEYRQTLLKACLEGGKDGIPSLFPKKTSDS